MIEILPVRGLPEIRRGDDLAALLAAAADLRDGDVVVVSQKVVSKSEGAVAHPAPGETPSAARRRLARESATRVVVDEPHLLVVATAHGLVCANAGVDASNVPDGALTLLPADADASARRLRAGMRAAAGADVAVVVADTFGRPWRVGQTDVAIGVAGLAPLHDERGTSDRHGRPLEATVVAVADELAAAADLARAKAGGVPAAVVRGFAWRRDDDASVAALVRDPNADLFPRGRGRLTDLLAGDAWAAGRPGPVTTDDLRRASAAAKAAGAAAGGAVEVAPLPGGDRSDATVLAVRVTGGASAFAAGAATATLVAALVDLGYGAHARPARPDEDAAAVVVLAGPPEPRGGQGR